MYYLKEFDVIVVGAGHAGIEASMASARIGNKTLLITSDIDTIGYMSCNPSIGGIGKGHLVKEIDALGGVMPKAADFSGIQFRKLNASKGPAVQSTRVQVDRKLYSQIIYKILKNQNNLYILQQDVYDIIIINYKIKGIVTNLGLKIFSRSVILTNGTFLNGKIYVGLKKFIGGRYNHLSLKKISKRLSEFSIFSKRLKTGTPPRINCKTIDFNLLEKQYSDIPYPVFSFYKIKKYQKQLPCYITYTNEKTHEIILNNLNKSPLFTGNITGIGPRYCPSLEDKILKFKNKSFHQIFLEPEGLNSLEIYPSGLSISLPFNIQLKVIRSIYGMENSHIIRPGYTVEYDYFDPKNLKLSLESKNISGLFFAGQINGTTGYEEAASQGLLAGLNASNLVNNKDPWIPKRDEAYLGVLVDDLCKKGINEPYRMFTSRAEYRLILREDNAYIRLTEIGRKFNLIKNDQWKFFNKKIENKKKIFKFLKKTKLNLKKNNKLNESCNIFNGIELLKRSDFNCDKILNFKEFNFIKKYKNLIKEIEIDIKYKGYVKIQIKQMENNIKYNDIIIPKNIDYNKIYGLSNEAISILKKTNAKCLKEIKKIQGITPVTISLLLIWFKKNKII